MKKSMHVVVVGGGFGGVKTALALSNKKNIQVTLISASTNFEYHGALYRSATGRSPLEVMIPLRTIFKKSTNIDLVLDQIISIQPEYKQIRSNSNNVYEYDYLVLAMGNTLNYFGLPDMTKKTFSANTMNQAIALRHKLTELFKKSHSNPSIVIVGGGASGTEIAGSVDMYRRLVARKYGAVDVKPKITLIEGAERVLPMFDPVLSAKAYKQLQKLGVDIRLNTIVDACKPGKVCVKGTDIMADAIIWTAGSRPVDFYNDNQKPFVFEKGRVKVDSFLRAQGHKDIFVIGDNANTPYAGMAQTAIHHALFIARNFVLLSKGKKATKYHAWHPMYVVPIGKNWAVLQSARYQWSGYRAWRARRRADLWVLRHFESKGRALKQWRQGNKIARF